MRSLDLLAHVDRHLDGDVSLGALAAVARRSPFELHRAWSRAVGETVKQYTLRVRLDRAAAALVTTRATVLAIALDSGFASHEVFTRAFARRFGVSPRAYRGRGLAGAAGRRELARRHAAVVRAVAPCVRLYRATPAIAPRRPPMTVTVSTRELPPQPALIIRRAASPAQIADAIGACLPRVFAHIQQRGLAMAGPPLVRYVEVGLGRLTLECGMPLAAAAPGDGDIEAIELPGGVAAVAVHAGPYDRLHETHAIVSQWIADHGHAAGGAPWEVYLTDPGQLPDPADWRTEIIYPLAR